MNEVIFRVITDEFRMTWGWKDDTQTQAMLCAVRDMDVMKALDDMGTMEPLPDCDQ